MMFKNHWGIFMLTKYFDNLKQPDGSYRIGLKILCNENDSTKALLEFARSIVSPVYADHVKSIRYITPLSGSQYEYTAVVDCFFSDREDAYHFIYILGSMSAWPEKSFDEVRVTLKNMLKEGDEELYEQYAPEH